MVSMTIFKFAHLGKRNRLEINQYHQTLLRTLTTRSAVLGLDFTAGRETSCGLESKTLNGLEGQGFVLPPNMKKVFVEIDLDSIDFQVSFIFRLCFSSLSISFLVPPTFGFHSIPLFSSLSCLSLLTFLFPCYSSNPFFSSGCFIRNRFFSLSAYSHQVQSISVA